MSRTRSAIRTFHASLVATVFGVTVGLLTTPLLLRWLGDERLGAFRVATEWMGYAVLLDFGLGGALQVALGRALSTGDRNDVASVIRSGVRRGLYISGLYIVLLLGIAVVAPYLVNGLTVELVGELRVGLLLSLVVILWAPLVGFRSLADASQRGHITHAALTAQTLLTALLSVGFAAAGFGLPGLFLAVAVGNGVSTALLAWDGLRRYPEILTRASESEFPVVFSGAMFVHNLCGRLSLLSDCIIVGLILGPTAVVVFTLTQRLMLLASTQVQSLGSSAWAALTQLHHNGHKDQFNRRLIQLTRLTVLLGLTFLGPLVAFNRAFVGLWVGTERYGGDGLTLVTLVYVLLQSVVSLWAWPIVTTGRVRVLIPPLVVGTVVNLGVSIGCTTAYGVVGPALGSVAQYALVTGVWIAVLLRREFGTPLRSLFAATVQPLLPAVPCFVGWFLLTDSFPLHELDLPVWGRWFLLTAGMAISAGSYLLIAWVTAIPANDRREILARIRRQTNE